MPPSCYHIYVNLAYSLLIPIDKQPDPGYHRDDSGNLFSSLKEKYPG
jgi:hypothetical protein